MLCSCIFSIFADVDADVDAAAAAVVAAAAAHPSLPHSARPQLPTYLLHPEIFIFVCRSKFFRFSLSFFNYVFVVKKNLIHIMFYAGCLYGYVCACIAVWV